MIADHGGVRMEENQPQVDEPVNHTETLRTMIQRAQEGDQLALGELRRIAQTPTIREGIGNLAKVLEQKTIDLFLDHDVCFKEAVVATVNRMRADLLGTA